MKLFDVLLCPLARVRIINVPADSAGEAATQAEAWLRAQPDLVAKQLLDPNRTERLPRDATQRLAFYDLLEGEPVHMAMVDVVGDREFMRTSVWIRDYESPAFILDPNLSLPPGLDFEAVANTRRWDDRFKLDVVRRFITARGLEKELADFALRKAVAQPEEVSHG